ncbi:DNA polymerase alpha catalytic subunit [Tritrichomonas musculus]|uniref:DNA polymerase n=1 Tax=Tritrichomonas musculus TaxID=1915356 RepID=A0ABR2K4G9_9EUKA
MLNTDDIPFKSIISTDIILNNTFISETILNNTTKQENIAISTNTNPIPMPPGNELDGYLFDIYEEDNFLFLFLKVNIDDKYQTICVQIEEPRYYLYFYPIDIEKKDNLVEEVREIAKKCGGHLIESKKQSLYQKKFYAFDNALIPNEAEWLCASFSRNSNTSLISPTGQNYKYVFGVRDRLTDCFCIHNLIKGPQWVHIQKLQVATDKKYTILPTFKIKNPKRVTLLNDNTRKIPDFNICSMALRYTHDITTNKNNILMISMKIRDQCDIEKYKSAKKTLTIVNTEQDLTSSIDNVVTCVNESQLLELFFDTIEECNIDIIVSYNLSTDLNLIKTRMADLNIENKCQIGRMTFIPGNATNSSHHPSGGRLFCNLRSMCDEFIKSTSNSFNYIVSQEFDNIYRQPLEHIDIVKEIKNNESKLISLIKYNARDSSFVDALIKKMNLFPLTLQLSQLSGCSWYRILGGSSKGGSPSSRCESLFVHTFSELGYIIPEKYSQPIQQQTTIAATMTPTNNQNIENEDNEYKRRVPQYKGGLVLEPKTGFYDNCVLVLDFNSLYPSIIREYNLCFTTLGYEKLDNDDARVELAIKTKTEKPPGVLPLIMSNLLDERKKVKAELAEVEKHITHSSSMPNDNDAKSWLLKEKRLKIQQQAIKILANAMYGYLGFQYSRFPAINIAEMVTCLGRHILLLTVDQITKMGHTVIYGDTDSVMIQTNTKDWQVALKTAESIGNEISLQYSHLKLGVESIFMKFLLLNKKKYASLVFELSTINKDAMKIATNAASTDETEADADKKYDENNLSTLLDTLGDKNYTKELYKHTWLKIKGLEIVRREWCPLSKYLCTFSLECFMYSSTQSEASKRIINEIERITSMLTNDGQPTSSVLIKDSKYGFENALKTEITVDDLIIYKGITKPLDQYKPTDKTINVNVARWMENNGHHVRANDAIPYIVIDFKAKEADKRAKHPDLIFNVCEADIEWYLTSQLLPPLLRMCEPFHTPTQEMIERAFGLIVKNPNSIKRTYNLSKSSIFNSIPQYKILTQLFFTCPECNSQQTVSSLYSKSLKDSSICCPSCGKKLNWKAVYNSIIIFVRKQVESWEKMFIKCNCGYLSQIGRLPMSSVHRTSRGAICQKALQADIVNTDILRTLMSFKKFFEEVKVGENEDLSLLRDWMLSYLIEIISLDGLNRFQFKSIINVEPFYSMSSE